MKPENHDEMKKNPSINKSGFTLIELLVTVAIAAVVMGLAVPSFNEAIRSNKLTSYTNDLVSALNLARSEAVKQGKTVTVRRVDNNSFTKLGAAANWEDGWDVFVDQNGDGIYDAVDSLIRSFPPLQSNYTLRGNALSFASSITYGSSGQSGGNGRFVICDDRDNNGNAEPNTSRLVIIFNGRARVMPDTDTPPDGIPDDGAGINNTSCNPP